MGGGVKGHILNCGKTTTNTCIIMPRLSLAKPGNPASIILSIHLYSSAHKTTYWYPIYLGRYTAIRRAQ